MTEDQLDGWDEGIKHANSIANERSMYTAATFWMQNCTVKGDLITSVCEECLYAVSSVVCLLYQFVYLCGLVAKKPVLYLWNWCSHAMQL